MTIYRGNVAPGEGSSVSTLDNVKMEHVEGLTALRALAPKPEEPVYLTYRSTLGDGGGGVFYWDSSNLYTEVTADTQSGIYVAPNSDSTGASGAWVRYLEGYITPEMFGADGIDDTIALKAAAEQSTYDLRLELISLYSIDLQAHSFTTTDAINLQSGATIVSTGFGGIQISNVVTSDQTQPPVFYCNNVRDITLAGIRFLNISDLDRRLAGSDTKGASNFIKVTSTANYSSGNIVVKDCYMERNLETAVYIDSSFITDSVKVLNNHFTESGGHCVGFKNVHGGMVLNNTSYDHKGVQFTGVIVGLFTDLSYGCEGCVVANNEEDGVVNGIKTESDTVLGIAQNNIITNNILRNFAEGARTGFGIQLNGVTDICEGNIIDIGVAKTTSVVTTVSIDGIKTSKYSKDAAILGNSVKTNNRALYLFIDDTDADVDRTAIVSNNFFESTDVQAIWVYNYKNVEFNHNQVTAKTYALQLRGLNISIVGGEYLSGTTAASVILIQPTVNNSVTEPFISIKGVTITGDASGVATGIDNDTTDFSMLHIVDSMITPSPNKSGILYRVVDDLKLDANTIRVSGTASNIRCVQTSSSTNEVFKATITSNNFINTSTGTNCQSLYGKHTKSNITSNYMQAVTTPIDINNATYTIITVNTLIGAGPTYIANGAGTGMIITGNLTTT